MADICLTFSSRGVRPDVQKHLIIRNRVAHVSNLVLEVKEKNITY